ncbi:winged helix-turn-helix domain-containing protein [Constantimarinum furrinae]|uniref:Two-component system response regulator n=1 Tax=Constantimarinum furrinae TaxID=2562285 RepID=A0A7G8PWN9_9FLAO|nr:winged helix-turn-helix domain-containing protein [Constantimarinum furrinae]QNJ98755.1 Two-component system response regulator [Constantimarinum furrinae]
MGKPSFYSITAAVLLLFFIGIFAEDDKAQTDFPERVKLSLREVGHTLLLAHGDSVSLVMPVVKKEDMLFELSFQRSLAIEPDSLISLMESAFKRSGLPEVYRVEVLQCSNREVVYSYGMEHNTENSIIPCRGRFLPENCYTIQLRFLNQKTPFLSTKMIILLLGGIALLLTGFLFFRSRVSPTPVSLDTEAKIIGSFYFYPEQNKLVQQATEIPLSNKECELLALFVASPNHIITREELTKKVWEDNGVIVGRSLDTYISKLRKKLKADENIKITNVHGVGYRLEVQ